MEIPSRPLDIISARITERFLSVHKEETIGNIKKILVTKSKEFETLDYIYVVDATNVLQGVASLKEVLQASDETVIKNIMRKAVVSVEPHIDQERIIYIVLEKGLKAVPVVDKENICMEWFLTML